MIPQDLLDILACPACKAPLAFGEADGEQTFVGAVDGTLEGFSFLAHYPTQREFHEHLAAAVALQAQRGLCRRRQGGVGEQDDELIAAEADYAFFHARLPHE